MTMEVFLDESGYTGEDLSNLEQPVFVLASTILTNEVSGEILTECFPKSRAGELKHSVLASRTRGKERIVHFIHELGRHSPEVATFVVHKQYALVTYMIDWWVEPAMRREGIDLYNRGGNIGLSNLIYYTLSSLLPDRAFYQHLTRFQTMMRMRTPRSYNEFWRPVYQAFHKATDGPLKDIFVFLLGGEKKLGFDNLLTLPRPSIDPALTCALPIIQHWHDVCKKPLTVIHDQSSAMASGMWIWEILVSKEVPKVEVGYDRRKIRFPLNVEKTRLENSKEYLQLQFADLLAGATATFGKGLLKQATDSSYAGALREAGIEEFIIGGLWPSNEVDPDMLETVGDNKGSLVEFTYELLRGKRNP